MPRFEKHIFVCTNVRPNKPETCCGPKGGENIQKLFKAKLKDLGLSTKVRANKSGCLSTCQYGITVVIYPQGLWYGPVTAEDVDEIIEKSILNNEVVERLKIPNSAPTA